MCCLDRTALSWQICCWKVKEGFSSNQGLGAIGWGTIFISIKASLHRISFPRAFLWIAWSSLLYGSYIPRGYNKMLQAPKELGLELAPTSSHFLLEENYILGLSISRHSSLKDTNITVYHVRWAWWSKRSHSISPTFNDTRIDQWVQMVKAQSFHCKINNQLFNE